MDTLEIAASGLHSAGVRLATSAHNVANLSTERFHPVRAIQTASASGGSASRIAQVTESASVDLVHEILEQSRARVQYTATLRFLSVESDLRGQLTDLLA